MKHRPHYDQRMYYRGSRNYLGEAISSGPRYYFSVLVGRSGSIHYTMMTHELFIFYSFEYSKKYSSSWRTRL